MRWLAVTVAVAACATPRPDGPRVSNAAVAVVAPPPSVTPAVPRFPLPPNQQAPWTADPGMPPALADAARTLFEQGFADPRGCEYREIELAVGSVWTGNAGTVKTHGL